LETKIFSPSGRGRTFFLTSLFIEPTDVGPAATFVSRAARSTASRSQESHPSSSAGPTSVGHPADRASVYESRLPESSPDDPPGTRSPTLPATPKTTASLPWLLCLPPP